MPNRVIDLTGKRFGRLTAVEIAYRKKDKQGDMRVYWKCKCDCGNTCIVSRNSLRKGSTQSCGCLRDEINHISSKKHGLYGTRIYKIWDGMKARCNCKSMKSYKHYGGRGITYCKEWEDFLPFYKWAIENGYDDDLTLERINVNGNYEPQNCRWITAKEQRYNLTISRKYTINGETKCLAEWCDFYKVPYARVHKRLTTYGYDILTALTKPPLPHKTKGE